MSKHAYDLTIDRLDHDTLEAILILMAEHGHDVESQTMVSVRVVYSNDDIEKEPVPPVEPVTIATPEPVPATEPSDLASPATVTVPVIMPEGVEEDDDDEEGDDTDILLTRPVSARGRR